jgi:hypothetical protein
MRSTELIQKDEAADENAERDPEVKIGGNGAKQVAASGVVGGHEWIAYRTAVLGASASLRYLSAGGAWGILSVMARFRQIDQILERAGAYTAAVFNVQS